MFSFTWAQLLALDAVFGSDFLTVAG